MSWLDFRCRYRFASGFQLDVAFEAKGRITSLFGPSGSGKTSVLSLVAGLQRPDEGRIALGPRSLVDTQRGVFVPIERRNVGLVFQDHQLFPHLSVAGNLRYGERRRRRRGGRQIACDRVVEVLELGDLLARSPRTLSGGERQRVALGRSLLAGPELLLLDEPLASLDQALKDRVLTYLERVVEQWRIPAIYVSHAEAEVRRLADWVLVLEQGHVARCGPPEETLTRACSSLRSATT